MFTRKDLDVRTIFVINCVEHTRSIRVQNGEFLLEEIKEEKKRVLTKIPFQKLLALFVIGHITITTPLIEKCHKFNVALVVMKPNLRPVFYWANTAEANYLLRQRQHQYSSDDMTIAKLLVRNKIGNQITALKKTRRKDDGTLQALLACRRSLELIDCADHVTTLMGLEGAASKAFFSSYFAGLNWKTRRPRLKCDVLNVALDIGYTILFNYVEVFLRMFGFDLYVGVYHRLWFKRKSLVCDLMEPFRCLVDHTVLLAFNRKQFKEEDFKKSKEEYYLTPEKCGTYYQAFYEALIPYKSTFFAYAQQYYRCFIGCKPITQYPIFEF